MHEIISYSFKSPLGLLSIFLIFNFGLFFLLRNVYEFFLRTIVYFYIVGILGSLLMFFLNPVYLTFFMSIIFYFAFMYSTRKKDDIDEKKFKISFTIDVSIYIFFLMTLYYLLKLF